MPFELLPNEKFAALAFRNASTEYFARALELDLGGGLWVVNTPPLHVGETWTRWIGSIHSDEVARANLWFIAKRTSSVPRILDKEDEDLKLDVWHLFLGLLLVGSPFYEGGYLLTGAHVSGETQVRQYTQTHQFLVSEGATHLTAGEGDIRQALLIRAGLRKIYASETHMRVRRGLRIFWEGLKDDVSIARLHKFVRAVEAVVSPRIGRTMRDMVHRCQTFTGRSPAAVSLLGECYELRSEEEHLWNWEDALPGISTDQRHTVMTRRVRQAEALARHVYSHILLSAAHMADFADAAIDAFWALPEHERLARWSTLDIVNIA